MAELMEGSPHSSRQGLTIRYPSDRFAAASLVRETAAHLGFGPREVEELVLVTYELVSNLLKYSDGGELILTELTGESDQGLQLESLDRGPGFSNAELASGDGWSTFGSLGYGLGTVNRFTDMLEIRNRPDPDGGAHIICRRRIRPTSEVECKTPLAFGAATRPKPGFKINGDDFFIKTWGNEALTGVIDGLGHGQFAQRAANKAVNYLRNHYDQPLLSIFQGVGRECRTTRGVVMALAHFDLLQGQMSFASIGNIETRIIGTPKPLNFVIGRGIIGVHSINPKVTAHEWGPGQVLIMHSDGLRSHWRPEDIPDLLQFPAEQMARCLLNHLSNNNDDATVVVVKHTC